MLLLKLSRPQTEKCLARVVRPVWDFTRASEPGFMLSSRVLCRFLNDRAVSRNPMPLPIGLGPASSSDAAIAEENRLVEALRDAAQGGGR